MTVTAETLPTIDKSGEAEMKILAELIPGKVAMATLTPDLLMDLAFISSYETKDPRSTSPQQHGYQREPMKARFPGIANYYNQGQNKELITPIIASARVYNSKDIQRFNELFSAGQIDSIHTLFTKSAFSIVDGQHRMHGLYEAWKKYPDFNANIPVMIYYGLDYAEEARLFDDINTNQRKLPKALIEATKLHIDSGDKSHAQTIREIAFAVAQDGDSVWKDHINMTGARNPDRSVTYEGLRRATNQMFPERLLGRLKNIGLAPEKVAKRYWDLVSNACSPAWNERPRIITGEDGNPVEEKIAYRLKDLVGVASLAKLAEDMMTTSLDKSQNNEENFWIALTDLVSKLGAVDWEKRPNNPWMASQAGFAGQKDLYDVLYRLVYLDEAPGDAVHP